MNETLHFVCKLPDVGSCLYFSASVSIRLSVMDDLREVIAHIWTLAGVFSKVCSW